MENKIRIENPCHENWNLMSRNQKGRFCNSCNKTVIDFTKMKHPEIEKYFIENTKSENICGYFKSNQVENSNIRYSDLKKRFNQIKIKPIKIMALFCLGIVFSLSTSCVMGKRIRQADKLVENDSINVNDNIKLLKNAVKK